MLLRFAVENHLSFRSHQELSFAASSLKDDPDGLIPCKSVPIGSVLPVAIIYGANASGKSNFVDAIATTKNFILWSHTHTKPGDDVSHRPFKLVSVRSAMPTKFEIDFTVDDVRYHYGFAVKDEYIVEEWLYAFPTSRGRMMFERDISQFKFGRELKGPNKAVAKFTTPSSLFLSTAFQYGHDQLVGIYEYFKSVEISRSYSVQGSEVSDRIVGDSLDRRVIKFLNLIESGVVGHRLVESTHSDRPKAARKKIGTSSNKLSSAMKDKPNEQNERYTIELAHLDDTEMPVYFDLDIESAGTRRLLLLLSSVFQALDEGTLLCVDEIDASLHTHAVEGILKLFCSPEINRKGAQLIATTHDTNLMGSSALRRDQVWFTEKRRDGATRLYSLSDYRTHKDDDFELGYLQGRFGAAPDDDFVWQFQEES